MPATYTHAVYGEMVLEALDAETRNRIEKYRDLYDIGLSGPDILFFYKPLSKNKIKELGYSMHEESARAFFEGARKKIKNSENPEAALVYIIGFINHFILDSECHPMINKIVAESTISHSALETELDASLMRIKGLDPVRTRVTGHIHSTDFIDKEIAPFFSVEPKEIKTALKSMITFLNLFVAPGKLKRNLVFYVLKKVNYYDSYRGLVFNEEADPEWISTCATLREKMDKATQDSVRFIHEYITTLDTDTPLDKRFDENYE